MAPGVEFTDLKWLAILAAMASNIVIGFLWYSPKLPTGRIWMKGMGMSPDHKVEPRKMAMSMLLMVVGTFFLMFVYAHNFVAYEDAYQLDDAGYQLTVMDGVMAGFFTWLGFFLPVNLGAVSWESKPWSFAIVNTAYHLVGMVVAGIILVAMT